MIWPHMHVMHAASISMGAPPGSPVGAAAAGTAIGMATLCAAVTSAASAAGRLTTCSVPDAGVGVVEAPCRASAGGLPDTSGAAVAVPPYSAVVTAAGVFINVVVLGAALAPVASTTARLATR